MCCCTASDILLCIVATIFPPLAVWFRSGLFSAPLLLNIILTLLGFAPGVVHAFYHISITSPLRREYCEQQGWAVLSASDQNTALMGTAQQQPVLQPYQQVHHKVQYKSEQQGLPPPYTESV
ncbi:HCL045Cp [Eremothecium sinecaudum]|uniref:HCL045Cp n=1 Tax=Eremothecium sinecaudum TaxID=45286 RepID=A0A0X8HRI2_9SACH|nr:HCL045Cp [Eremothecium sinecaudum]AMD20106.1 HCL045Cp [Eremothecium sinecaudum]